MRLRKEIRLDPAAEATEQHREALNEAFAHLCCAYQEAMFSA
ncbi:hypothetical protein ACIO3O_39930 [Streptomyces sp. NPDC087440]